MGRSEETRGAEADREQMNVGELCRRITEFGFMLFDAEFALAVNPHVIEGLPAKKKKLLWAREKGSPLRAGSQISDYLSIVEARDYSYLMNDGGVIQIAFVFDAGRIAWHRLVHHPCPFPVDAREIVRSGEGPVPLADFIIETFMDDPGEHLLQRSPVRFDYDPDRATDLHPASHLTINDSECRIPVRSPLRFDTFMKFVLDNFYSETRLHQRIQEALVLRQEEECLSEHDRRRVFLDWRHPESRSAS